MERLSRGTAFASGFSVKQVEEKRNPIVITQTGEAKAVLLDVESYQNLIAAITLMKVISIGKKMAMEIYSRIMERVDSVKEFPATGRVVPELTAIGISEIHELIEPPWRIFYRIYQNEET